VTRKVPPLLLETGMENLFKQNLLRLRKPVPPKTFSEALLGTTLWGKRPVLTLEKPLIPKENFTEKAQVLESLERFAQDQLKEAEVPVIKFDRGEIHLKPESEWLDIAASSDLSSLFSTLSLPDEAKDILLRTKKKGEVKAIFVGESFRPLAESKAEFKTGFLNELILGFPVKTAEYFERMIKAMKLAPEEVIIYFVENGEEDLSAEVIGITAFFQPEVVITLGAKASNKILKSNDRLSLSHGQFFTRKINSTSNFTVVPLFHPTIIESNQNMKKTAWADMQKIMRHLKKL
jgi:hypothetical protein